MRMEYNNRDCTLYRIEYMMEVQCRGDGNNGCRYEYWELSRHSEILYTSFSDYRDHAQTMIRAYLETRNNYDHIRNLEITSIEPIGKINHFLVT